MSEIVIETKNLTKIYGEQKSVSDLNLHVRRGHIYGLLGRNGAGKTTTMRMLLGLVRPTEGSAYVFGKDVAKNAKSILPRIGSLIESPGFYPNLTGTENLEIFADLRGVTRSDAVKYAMQVVGLPYKDKKLFSKYSLGMKQRLAIANAILHDPELLVLDEPVNGLDPIGISEMRNFLKKLSEQEGKTILISSHILSEISMLADDVGILSNGVLLEEESLTELEKKNSRYIYFVVSDAAAAVRLLEERYHTDAYHVDDDHTIRILDVSLPMPELNRLFMEAGIDIKESRLCEDSLEDYFKRVTGGVGIG